MSARLILCYLEPISEEEINSVQKYWALNDASKDDFKYTLKQIDSLRASECRPVSSLIKKVSCLALDPAFFCKECNRGSPVNNRTQFVARQKLNVFRCKECEEKKLIALREKSLFVIQDFLKSKLIRNDCFHKLSYMHKIIMIALFSGEYQENKPIITRDDAIALTGSETVSLQVLSSLVSLGVLVDIADIPEEVRHAEAIIYGQPRINVYKNNRYGNRVPQNPFAIKSGFYFSLPIGFVDSLEFLNRIYDDVVNGRVTVEEVSEIKRLVIDVRVENFYRLVDQISSEFNLDIANSAPLGALLYHLSKKYPITNCYAAFCYCAKEVVLYMHKKNPDMYSRNHLFTKFVSNYIQDVERKGWELKYSRKLPESVYTSNLEAVVSRIFIEGHFNWHGLSADEIVNRWISKITVRDCHSLPAL